MLPIFVVIDGKKEGTEGVYGSHSIATENKEADLGDHCSFIPTGGIKLPWFSQAKLTFLYEVYIRPTQCFCSVSAL